MVRGKKFFKARENYFIPLKAGKTFWVP